MDINLNNKKFRPIGSSDNGDVSSDTIFHYRQNKDKVWATYVGGKIEIGTLVGKIKHNTITLIYQQISNEGEFLTGYCDTDVSVKKDKIILNEKWQWTCKDFSKGKSLLKEI